MGNQSYNLYQNFPTGSRSGPKLAIENSSAGGHKKLNLTMKIVGWLLFVFTALPILISILALFGTNTPDILDNIIFALRFGGFYIIALFDLLYLIVFFIFFKKLDDHNKILPAIILAPLLIYSLITPLIVNIFSRFLR